MKCRKMILLLLFLFICDLSLPQSNQWFKYTTSNSMLPTNDISKMFKDKNGKIWLGTSEGLVMIEHWSDWQLFNSNNSGLHNDNATRLYVDRLNNVWVATSEDDMDYFLKYDGLSWSTIDSGQTCFSWDYEFKFAVYSNGMKWVTDNQTYGLTLFLDSVLCQIFTPEQIGVDPMHKINLLIDDDDIFWCAGEPHLYPVVPEGMAKTDGTVWITKTNTFNFSIDTINNIVWGTTYDAIEKINIQSLQLIQKYYYPDGASGSHPIFVDNQGNVWTSTWHNNPQIPRLYKFEPDSANWKIFNLNEILTGWPYIETINQDNFGNILLATGYDGLVLFNENGVVTNIEENFHSLPEDFTLEQNYPNPFNPSTIITYSIPEASQVAIRIYDVIGKEMETLINDEQSAGIYKVTWNGENYSSGIYFYKMETSSFVEIKKMVLIK